MLGLSHLVIPMRGAGVMRQRVGYLRKFAIFAQRWLGTLRSIWLFGALVHFRDRYDVFGLSQRRFDRAAF